MDQLLYLAHHFGLKIRPNSTYIYIKLIPISVCVHSLDPTRPDPDQIPEELIENGPKPRFDCQ